METSESINHITIIMIHLSHLAHSRVLGGEISVIFIYILSHSLRDFTHKSRLIHTQNGEYVSCAEYKNYKPHTRCSVHVCVHLRPAKISRDRYVFM